MYGGLFSVLMIYRLPLLYGSHMLPVASSCLFGSRVFGVGCIPICECSPSSFVLEQMLGSAVLKADKFGLAVTFIN